MKRLLTVIVAACAMVLTMFTSSAQADSYVGSVYWGNSYPNSAGAHWPTYTTAASPGFIVSSNQNLYRYEWQAQGRSGDLALVRNGYGNVVFHSDTTNRGTYMKLMWDCDVRVYVPGGYWSLAVYAGYANTFPAPGTTEEPDLDANDCRLSVSNFGYLKIEHKWPNYNNSWSVVATNVN